MKWPSTHVARDTVLFVFGILGIIYETVVQQADKPTLLILFGAMIGLPAFLSADARNVKTTPAKKIPATRKPPVKK